MKAARITLFVLTIYAMVNGQSQIDSLLKSNKEIDKTKEYLIYDYRLPSWGYSQFYFDISAMLSEVDETGDTKFENNKQHRIRFKPTYYKYYESEKVNFSFRSSLTSYHFGNKEERVVGEDSWLNRNNNIQLYFNLDAYLRNYLSEKWFINFKTQNKFNYRENYYKNSQVNNGFDFTQTNSNILREYMPSIHIETGYGRIRNVTPVFRALRFNERINNIRGTNTINPKDLGELSAFFTRKNIYSKIYDRSSKYFYYELPNNILSKLSNLNPWEIIYIDDVWDEIIGNRYEGFEVNGGFSINYEKKSYSVPMKDYELFLLGLYLEHKYYHNINSFYQLGTSVYASFSTALNKNTLYNYFGNGNIKILNLYNLTDKMLIEFDLGLATGFNSSKSDETLFNSKWERMDTYFTNLTFRYFIENNLSLNAQLVYNYYHNWPEYLSFNYDGKNYYNYSFDKEKNWTIRLDLRYYFIRSLH